MSVRQFTTVEEDAHPSSQAPTRRPFSLDSGGLKTRQIDTLEGLYALEDAWRELFAASGCPSVFSSWEWISEWCSHFLPTLSRRGIRAIPIVLAVYDRKQDLVGLLPFVQTPAPCALLGERRLIQIGMISCEGLEPEEPTLLCRSESQAEIIRCIREHLMARPKSFGRWNHFTMQSLHPGGVISHDGISRSHSSRWTQSHFFTGCLTIALPPHGWNFAPVSASPCGTTYLITRAG